MNNTAKNIVVVFKNNGMGVTDEQPLRDKLTKTFLYLYLESADLPRVICFYTEGVRLACEGSPVLEELTQLEAKGVRLILCQTCLNYFGLQGKVKVGIVGGMGDILTAITQADSTLMV